MGNDTVMLTFSRDGQRDGETLTKTRQYQARVDNGTPSVFQSPWDEEELSEIIDVLRNEGDQKPAQDYLAQLGKSLGASLHQIIGLQGYLADGNVTIHLQLDYPELARLPWELASANEFPHRHLLEEGVRFVRQVPVKRRDKPAEWPSGRNASLRLLYLWGEGAAGKVPHEEHETALKEICERYGIKFVPREMKTIDSVTEAATEENFHFVHLLAHGALDDNDEWGLALSDEIVTGKQIALALTAGRSVPAMVSVAACDSANNRDNSFGSVAFEIHASGIPFVHASQFRLRKSISVETVGKLYGGVLGGEDPLGVVHDIKRQLAPRANEGWVNEVVYCRYRLESLEEFFTIARQQAALRRARNVSKRELTDDGQRDAALGELKHEKQALQALVERLEEAAPRNPAAIAETYGLLGSLERRMAEIRRATPSSEDLRSARDYYESGFAADANSHYCGINVIHLSLQVGDNDVAEKWMPMIAWIAANQGESDFWSWASAGDVHVYSGDAKEAAKSYRKFVRGAERAGKDSEAVCGYLNSSLAQLIRIREAFGATRPEINTAVKAAIEVLNNASEHHCQ